MSEPVRKLQTVLDATRQMPYLLYKNDGLAFAILGTLLLPIAVPFAAAWYYSIDKVHREALDEWDELTQ